MGLRISFHIRTNLRDQRWSQKSFYTTDGYQKRDNSHCYQKKGYINGQGKTLPWSTSDKIPGHKIHQSFTRRLLMNETHTLQICKESQGFLRLASQQE